MPAFRRDGFKQRFGLAQLGHRGKVGSRDTSGTSMTTLSTKDDLLTETTVPTKAIRWSLTSGRQGSKQRMPNLEFSLDWMEAEDVRGPELSATWAHLVMRVGDSVLTRVLDKRAKTVRDGIFVSVYPLAEWIVANWWSLFY